MDRDDSKEAVFERTKHVWPNVHNALLAGIETAIYLHDCAGWHHEDDKHLYQHMIRRKAIEVYHDLKPAPGPGFGESDTTILPMSGLILHLPDDVVRIWHIATVNIPTPSTPAKREFIDQPRSDQFPLWEEVSDEQQQSAQNRLVLCWTVSDHKIERFQLVRPAGTKRTGKHVAVDWDIDLLERLPG
ncbi:hypothetical protein [Nonomuraea sp. NPDC050202]|uniref:hypothetical protein n=1 Tax=Nonomuraea sp. NPDC050202 TaxID=3155035 RepID=UPI0033FCE3D4